jgi:hypothetical protein
VAINTHKKVSILTDIAHLYERFEGTGLVDELRDRFDFDLEPDLQNYIYINNKYAGITAALDLYSCSAQFKLLPTSAICCSQFCLVPSSKCWYSMMPLSHPSKQFPVQ